MTLKIDTTCSEANIDAVSTTTMLNPNLEAASWDFDLGLVSENDLQFGSENVDATFTLEVKLN